MDTIVCTALEEICCQGNTGIPLVSLWSRLSPLSPSVKSHVWRNLLAIPQLQFKSKNTVYGPSDASIQQLEDALRLDLRIIANEKLRGNFVGLYDAQANYTTISVIQRCVLERLAVARANGVAQNLLAKEFGKEGRNFFYIVKQLESRGLIVRQPADVKTKEVDGEGDSKTTSSINTNMIFLSAYAKPLGSQQKFEICKEDNSSETPMREHEATAAGDSLISESTKYDTLIKDFLPAMQAICDKLEEANEKVLVVSDIKQDLGYLGSHSKHRAWRSVCRRLTDSHVVEEFDAVVNNKVERCLRLLKSFSAKDFNYSGKKQFLKFGRSIPKTEQTLELPIDNQIYDMIDAEGSKGLAMMEVCERLGLDKKKSYSRLYSICSKVRMHLQAESHKKTRVFRVWTSRHAGSESSDSIRHKAENLIRETNDFGIPHGTGVLAQTSIEQSLAVSDADFSTPARLTDFESSSGVHHFATPVRLTDSDSNPELLDCSPSNAKRRKLLTCRNLQESFHEIADKVVDTAMGSPDMALSETNYLVLPKPTKPQVHHPHPITVESSRRERRILERLNEEKFVVRAELNKWLMSFEKDRRSKIDKKTIDRILNRLKEEGLCRCMDISVPNITNCGLNRTYKIVFHPSIQSLTQDVVGEIDKRIRSFELELRGKNLSKRKICEPIPVLNDVQRGQTNVDLNARASKSGAMRDNGFVHAKMVRVKLLHCFLWDYFSSLPGWDSSFPSLHDHKSENLFALEDAFRAMPLELFLQVVGSTQKADDMIKKCKQVMRLSELPTKEYKLLVDTLATGRFSMLIDILRRLKLIQMVSSRFRRDDSEEECAKLTHALELKPYIEEPVFVAAASNIMSLDFRPRIRHDFILSNRDAVDEYWLTLEYCYATADYRAAKQAFPGSVVREVFHSRSWASDRGMTAEQRAKLSQRIANNEKEKLSFKECEKIAKDLNLTLEQVMHAYHAKQGRRMKSKSKDRNYSLRNSPSCSGKRKRETLIKNTGDVRSTIVDEQKVLNSDAIDASNSYMQADQTPIPMHEHNQHENAEIRELTEDEGQCSTIINRHASSKTTSTPSQRFSWTDEADKKLLSQYVRHRAALGAKFHGVTWASVQDLPAPPSACKRRIQILMKNDKFRKALMRLCNLLGERYAKHLEMKQKCLPKSNSSHVRVRYLSEAIGGTNSGCAEHGKDICFDEEKWDDFNEKSISQAFSDVLELKKMAKLVAPKRTRPGSREWSNRDIVEEGSEMAPPSVQSEDIQNVSVDQVKDTSRRSGHHRLHQTSKPLDNGSIQVRKSLAVSTAVELLKLVFLSMPTAPGMPNLLEDTLRRYSERDLFTAYSYLRDKKFLVGGSGGQPIVLSQNFLHSISKSPFPINTGTRAAKFSSWLLDHERDLMAGGVALTSDLQCGDVLNFFSLVSSGELSISVSLPEEGVGEPGDRRGLKRGADDIEESEPDSAKKLRLLGEGEINFRKEKGFPGIAVCVRRVVLPTANAVELFKDDDSRTGELHFKSGETSSGCGSDGMKELFNSTEATVIPSSPGDSPWQAMASVASCIMSEPADEQVNQFSPGVFETVSNALQKAGDQGLSVEEVSHLIVIPSREICECILDVLQTFGLALKVNSYNSFRVVHSFYRSKYFLTLEEGGTSQTGQQSRPVNYLERAFEEHRSNDIVASNHSSSQDKQDHGVHKVTILNLPEMTQTSNLHEASIGPPTVTFGTGIEGETKSPVPIFPWVNADGSINKLVFDGLVRRVLGTVMQSPGIPEEEILNLMDVLNPQSCRKLLELMILDGYLKLREMVQTKFTGPPSLLAGLLVTGPRKPELIRRKHYFASSKGLFAL